MQAIRLSLMVALVASGCGTAPLASPAQTSPSRNTSKLRIINKGPGPIFDLTVLFPRDKVFFGNVPSGRTTKYLAVPGGVFSYGAFQFSADGKKVVHQMVMDWVGETPMEGRAFTYTLEVVEGSTTTRLRIVNANRDK